MNAATAHQLAMQNQFLQQQRRDSMKGQCLLKLMQFSEHLSGFPVRLHFFQNPSFTLTRQQGSKGREDLSYWKDFVTRFFSVNGVFRHSLHITDAEDTTDKQYEITFPAIARYFHTHFGSGVKNMQLIMDKGVTDRPLPGECHCIENSKASLVYWFETGSHVRHSWLSLSNGETNVVDSWSRVVPYEHSLMLNRRSNFLSFSRLVTTNLSHESRSLMPRNQPICG